MRVSRVSSAPSWHLKFYRWLSGMPRARKTLILATLDFTLFTASVLLAFVLRVGFNVSHGIWVLWPLAPAMGLTGVAILHAMGFYNALVRNMDNRALTIMLGGVAVNALVFATLGFLINSLFLPRSTAFFFFVSAILLIGGTRFMVKLYNKLTGNRAQRLERVLIYGAGEAGQSVGEVIRASGSLRCVGFIDDDSSLQGARIKGRRIYSPDNLDRPFQRHEISRVLLCLDMPDAQKKRECLRKLEPYSVRVDVVPPLTGVVGGTFELNELREVQIGDLLGRETVPALPELFDGALKDQTVLVTGGAGSIGSELCRQIAANGARRLVVLDQSEYGLYKVQQEFENTTQASNCDVSFELGSVCDGKFLDRVFDHYRPNIVYHAAAYKHVPMIEDNPLAAIWNNVFGTLQTAQAADKSSTERFILVSTDKAVRPTNVMGATKRVTEQLLQSGYVHGEPGRDGKATTFAMVRFGNVLGSSGSVVPAFKRQIASGGPIQVTHREIERYFMTIPEAAQLVIQAGSLAKGQEIFVLDMGEPVKISELAEFMVRLSGLTIKTKDNPQGDIVIQYTGLRPGEKLYEELTIDSDLKQTVHPKIMISRDNGADADDVALAIAQLRNSLEQNDSHLALRTLSRLVEGFEDITTQPQAAQ